MNDATSQIEGKRFWRTCTKSEKKWWDKVLNKKRQTKKEIFRERLCLVNRFSLRTRQRFLAHR